MNRMTELVDDFFLTMTRSCGDFSEAGGRQEPNLFDMMQTLEYLGISLTSLEAFAQSALAKDPSRRAIKTPTTRQGKEPWVNPTEDFLPSDSEEDGEVDGGKSSRRSNAVWNTIMQDIVPDHLPPQPPRHNWMFTPVYGTEMLSELPTLQLVDRKLENARLVETSLRKLIKDTDQAALQLLSDKSPESAPQDSDAPPSEAQTVLENAVVDEPMPASSLAAAAPVPPSVPSKRVLPRPVNYKTSWYASLASADSKLPNANLYTARLRGGVEEGPGDT
ncbi:hypothetical protein MVES1_001901 [Malassezia vespertilionis]|uniref:uncharacterized protein n=1 Tax=Malassezia vespertilionis TaxID=2020962 RepID=UPI0024B06BF1|nr:uncharacterized protein MVES1_001901 [Malassezia vespertilionis]WFD06550.1 hypothetical protein MVES1_001901 [Malassezia vespertilionis]